MNLVKASQLFDAPSNCFLVQGEDDNLVSFAGLPCCYRGDGYAEDLLVTRVVDIETMSILWDESMPEPDDPPVEPIEYPAIPTRLTTVTVQTSEDLERIANPPSSAVYFDDDGD